MPFASQVSVVVAAEVDLAAGLAQRVARLLAEEAAAAAARHFLPPFKLG